MTKMNFNEKTLLALFSESNNLAIPMYQRGYAWGDNEWDDFWNDIQELVVENEDDHFLGQVVTNQQDDKEYIVDGQQRITTAMIFLAVLREQFNSLDNPRAAVRADDIQKELIGDRGKYVLTQAENNEDFFRNLIQVPGQFESVKKTAVGETNVNFVKAYEFLNNKVNKQLKELIINEDRLNCLENLRSLFLQHMFIMKISTNDEASAFVIFETLNARGRELNSSDLLKNHLFRKAKGDDSIQKSWDAMMEPLSFSSKKATSFIRSYWNGTHDFVTEKKLYRALNREVTTRSDAVNLVEKLALLSDDFAAMLDAKREPIYQNKQLIENLQILNLLSAKTFYPLILVMIDKDFSESDIVTVTYKIISFTVRNFTIGGLVANRFEKSFANIARDLYRGNIDSVVEINRAIADEMIDDIQFADALKVASVKTEKTSKYILAELAYPDDENKIDLDDVKVIRINEDVENKERLGNKLLLTKIENKGVRSAANKQLAVSKSRFKGTNVYANKIGHFNSEDIEQRQVSWTRDAIQIWAK